MALKTDKYFPRVFKLIRREKGEIEMMSIRIIYRDHNEAITCHRQEATPYQKEGWRCDPDFYRGEPDRPFNPHDEIELEKSGGAVEVHPQLGIWNFRCTEAGGTWDEKKAECDFDIKKIAAEIERLRSKSGV